MFKTSILKTSSEPKHYTARYYKMALENHALCKKYFNILKKGFSPQQMGYINSFFTYIEKYTLIKNGLQLILEWKQPLP